VIYLIRSLAIVALILAIAVPQASATPVQYLSVTWNTSSDRVIQYLFNGSPVTARIAAGTGYVDAVDDGIHTPGGRSLSDLYCVDLFAEAPENEEWDVHEYTQADGLTGWLTPVVGGTDHWRDEGDLLRTAWLAQTYGRQPLTNDEKVALNVVMWKAAYGDRFQYVSGLSSGDQTTAYNTYLAGYELGEKATRYTWYDSNYEDTADLHQDFMTPPPAVPEPSTLMLLASGLLGSGFVIRRRRS